MVELKHYLGGELGVLTAMGIGFWQTNPGGIINQISTQYGDATGAVAFLALVGMGVTIGTYISDKI